MYTNKFHRYGDWMSNGVVAVHRDFYHAYARANRCVDEGVDDQHPTWRPRLENMLKVQRIQIHIDLDAVYYVYFAALGTTRSHKPSKNLYTRNKGTMPIHRIMEAPEYGVDARILKKLLRASKLHGINGNDIWFETADSVNLKGQSVFLVRASDNYTYAVAMSCNI